MLASGGGKGHQLGTQGVLPLTVGQSLWDAGTAGLRDI